MVKSYLKKVSIQTDQSTAKMCRYAFDIHSLKEYNGDKFYQSSWVDRIDANSKENDVWVIFF